MKELEIEFNFRARFYQLGEISERTRAIWFVVHGYGQLAKYFVKKFEGLVKHDIVVVAPEGLSRFYLENFQAGKGRSNDRVGATWMTKENRLTDIRNYITFLDKVFQQTTKPSIPVTILGFSQGAATASRWALSKNIRFHQLILWSGVFPPDMDFASAHDSLKDKKVHFVYGTKDPFLTDDRFVEFETIKKKLNVPVTVTSFEGEHEVDEKTLVRFVTDPSLPS